jgi:chitinase
VPIYVGSSSRDIRLTGTVTVRAGEEEPVVPRGEIIGIAARCVDVAGGGTANGTAVQLFDCNDTPAQRWSVTPDGTIEALGKCLDVTNAGTADGTPVQLYECNGTGAQQWRPRADASLLNPASGRCLDTDGGGSANGTRLVISDCNGGASQRWQGP